MAEVIITSSVVAVILVTLYIGINRMNNAYDKRNRYYDLDAQQIAMEVNDLLKRNYTTISRTIFSDYSSDSISLITIEEDSEIGYGDILNIYDYDKLNTYLVNNKKGFNTLKSDTSNNLFKDYIDYYINKYNLDDYSYFVVVELQKQDDYYYYTLKVKE